MIDAVRHLLAAYPQGAFVDVTEKTIQLLVLGPVRSPETATEVGSPSSGDDDTTDSTNSSSSSSVGEPVSSQTIRITIRSQADDLESAAGQNPTDGSDSAQLKQSWNPYQKSLQGSDRMVRFMHIEFTLNMSHIFLYCNIYYLTSYELNIYILLIAASRSFQQSC